VPFPLAELAPNIGAVASAFVQSAGPR
jgi:hypothetical protein